MLCRAQNSYIALLESKMRKGQKFLQILTPLLVGQTQDTHPISATSQVFVARRNFEGEGTGREGDTPSAYRPITSPLTTHQQATPASDTTTIPSVNTTPPTSGAMKVLTCN